MKISNEAASAAVGASNTLLNGGFVDVFDGSQPATADTGVTGQVRLASLGLASPAFAPAVNGVAVSNSIAPDPSMAATGTASWARFYKADHVSPVMDMSVGAPGSGKEIIVNSTMFQAGAVCSLTGISVTLPESS